MFATTLVTWASEIERDGETVPIMCQAVFSNGVLISIDGDIYKDKSFRQTRITKELKDWELANLKEQAGVVYAKNK